VAYQQPVAPMALKPHASVDHSETSKLPGGLSSVVTVGGSLAVVLGIFLLIVWLLRRASPRGAGILPAEAFEMLGRAPLANHQQVHLLRCGNKLLLVAVTGAGAGAAAKTLTEITDLAEVDRLAGLCRRARAGSPTATFRQVFHQVEEHHV
jgi:flagellar protein FliO/FliZ